MAQSIVTLQSVISRSVNPLDAAVISATQIHAGSAVNIIPDSGAFHGTIRTFTSQPRALIMDRLKTIITETARAMGCRADITFEQMSRPVVNDPQVAARLAAEIAARYPDLILHTDFRTMAAEDVAYFLEQIPGTFFLVGSSNVERQLDYPHHHPRFDFDEAALMIGASLLVSAVAAYVLPQPVLD
jgi:amidohydrolase